MGTHGSWIVGEEKGVLSAVPGSIVFRFQARDLHLVLGPALVGKAVRFRVRIDGAEPGSSHGEDTDASGNGVVREQRLYQLIRQPPGVIHRHTFTIEFLDGGCRRMRLRLGERVVAGGDRTNGSHRRGRSGGTGDRHA